VKDLRTATGSWRGFALLLVSALVLAACGSPDEDAPADDASDESEDESGDDPGADDDGDAAPEDGQTFIYAAAGVPNSLDVTTTYQGDPSRVNMYEWGSTLVEYDADDLAGAGCDELATAANIRPGLAESWEYNDDQTQLIFTLREGVVSPAGNELTADDVVWSLDRAKEQSGVVQFLISQVANFADEGTYEAVDERTVAVNLDVAGALDASVFTYPMFAVHDSAVALENATDDDPWATEWMTENVATFGPWQLESFDPGNEVVYTANPNFWDTERRGNVERLVIRNIDEASTRLQLVQTGEVDYAERLSFQEYETLENASTVDVLNCVSPNRDMLMLNMGADERFDDPDVRAAFSLAIDREALVAGVYRGFATPTTNGLSEVYWTPPADAPTIEFDPDRARELLEGAGFGDGLAVEMTVSPTRPGAHAESLAIQMQSMLADVGIDASINLVAGSTEFSDLFFDGQYESIVYLEPPALGDPFYSLNLYNTTVTFQNTHGYDNPRYDEVTEQILRTEPGAERDELMAEASTIIVEDTPVVYLVERTYTLAFNEGISGYVNQPHGSVMVYEVTKG
jgi:peptide/nickel transport system substrate-binding protein